MLNIGPQELILVLIVALVVVGPHRLPELGRTIGRAMREFRKIQDDVKDSIRLDLDTAPKPSNRPRQTSPKPVEPDDDGSPSATAPGPVVDPDPSTTEGDGEPRAAG